MPPDLSDDYQHYLVFREGHDGWQVVPEVCGTWNGHEDAAQAAFILRPSPHVRMLTVNTDSQTVRHWVIRIDMQSF